MDTMSAAPLKFPHRRNDDGTYDSICPMCFQTIDTRGLQESLVAEEKVHVCYPSHIHPPDVSESDSRDSA